MIATACLTMQLLLFLTLRRDRLVKCALDLRGKPLNLRAW